ncbi:sialate O-acetylesterase [Aurantibacter sp.]|uniref:sialate O-acetylesterase n=1 Tax=Aurantibacter sp. TaxID=2807103 RepID=UPI0032667DC2
MNKYLLLFFATLIFGCNSEKKDNRTENFPNFQKEADNLPNRDNVWIYVMAGQSNMAGRGIVEANDTIASNRILTINKHGKVIFAKEPLHFYEPTMAGLDMGMSFGREMIKNIPDSVSVLLLPTAVGGSSISQWINNEVHREVKLLSNFQKKIALGKNLGVFKGILWHQGESDTNSEEKINNYSNNLGILFSKFRKEIGNRNLPIVMGELGAYSKNPIGWERINKEIGKYSETDKLVQVVSTKDLIDKGDKLHFNSEGIRLLGKRYAQKFIAK